LIRLVGALAEFIVHIRLGPMGRSSLLTSAAL